MNIYYKSSTPTWSEIWEKGMICAVFKEDEDQWFRGIIEENLPEDKFQVYCYKGYIKIKCSKS